MTTKVLVTGAGGFIGSHLVKDLKEKGYWVRGVDIKYPEYSETVADEFEILDLRQWANCLQATRGVNQVYALAADMGGMGFISKSQGEILHNNALINIHTLEAARVNGVERYFYTSSACCYPEYLQMETNVTPLKEEKAFPASPDSCLTPDTEVMTKTGFKPIADITLDDEVATISNEGFLEFHKPTDKQVYNHNGNLIHFKSKYYDCIVTPNHKVYASQERNLGFEVIEAQKFIDNPNFEKGFFKRGCVWISKKEDPKVVAIPSTKYEINRNNAFRGDREKEGYEFELDDYLKFLGWFITEGNCGFYKGKDYVLQIRQTNQENLYNIKALCDKMNLRSWIPSSEKGRVMMNSKSLWNHFKDFGKGAINKKLPPWVLDLSTDKLKILYDTMMLGDGKSPKNNPNKTCTSYFTSSPYLRDQFVEICLKLGYSCSINTRKRNGNINERYVVQICTENSSHKVTKDNIKEINYSGLVYDLTVPNHVFYIRHNGKHLWTGNSYGWEKIFTELLCKYYQEQYNMNIHIVRFHNIFGAKGTWEGGREKAPAALCRKIAYAKLMGETSVEIWGDGEQTRSFCYIDDCLKGIYKLMQSDFDKPLNLGQDRMVSINELADIIMKIADVKLDKIHIEGPQGVRGRNSDNSLLKEVLGWSPEISLEDGLTKTYKWIEEQVKKKYV